MKPAFKPKRSVVLLVGLALPFSGNAVAVETRFFTESQVAVLVESGETFDTISSNGYLFTYTRDKMFTGGVGMSVPIGRPVRVEWPLGVEAQAVTVAPFQKAQIAIRRVDGNSFAVSEFSAKLLANTAGAGGSFEVVPTLAGEDLYQDPVAFFASGNAGNTFSYSMAPNAGPMNPYGQTTAALVGADAYKINLYVDFALTGLALVDASSPPVPEPETYAMLLAGLCLIGSYLRRARVSAS